MPGEVADAQWDEEEKESGNLVHNGVVRHQLMTGEEPDQNAGNPKYGDKDYPNDNPQRESNTVEHLYQGHTEKQYVCNGIQTRSKVGNLTKPPCCPSVQDIAQASCCIEDIEPLGKRWEKQQGQATQDSDTSNQIRHIQLAFSG